MRLWWAYSDKKDHCSTVNVKLTLRRIFVGVTKFQGYRRQVSLYDVDFPLSR